MAQKVLITQQFKLRMIYLRTISLHPWLRRKERVEDGCKQKDVIVNSLKEIQRLEVFTQ